MEAERGGRWDGLCLYVFLGFIWHSHHFHQINAAYLYKITKIKLTVYFLEANVYNKHRLISC